MEKTPKEGQVYEHYKRGTLYEILTVSEDVDTLEIYITYKQIPKEDEEVSNKPWTRTKKNFMADIEIDGKKTPQYKRIR